jgi:putative adenylate-forming enzyme
MSDAAWAAATFALDRWVRRPGKAAHDKALQRFLARDLPAAPFYAPYAGQPLESLPIVDKATVLQSFAAFNRHGIELGQALEVAEAAERGRDFAPMIGDITVGLSSGTSGRRGVFLVSPSERRHWAGVVMAQMLSRESLAKVLRPNGPPLRVALFLRSNSNLYTTLNSRRVEFAYFDINQPIEQQAQRLCARAPDVLVGPPSVLRRLAELCAGRFHPLQVVSVAETLEPDDEPVIEAAFGVPVEQIYQRDCWGSAARPG